MERAGKACPVGFKETIGTEAGGSQDLGAGTKDIAEAKRTAGPRRRPVGRGEGYISRENKQM